ncbi:MAG: HAD family phosphatase [Firmicutes bacterium]|nr:HAD family phosphatase [Bacillota bacterium]
MIKAFIFDIDGTLIDTNQLHIDSWIKAFKEFGVTVARSDIQLQLGRRATEIAKTLLPREKEGYVDSIVDRKRIIFREHFSEIKVFPMVKELFGFLSSKAIKIALATSTTRHDAEFYVGLMSVESFVDGLIAAEDILHSKPDPEIFMKCAELLGVKPHESVAIGDSTHDILASVRAGMIPVGVLTGGYSREELLKTGADKVYRDIADLYNHIGDIL